MGFFKLSIEQDDFDRLATAAIVAAPDARHIVPSMIRIHGGYDREKVSEK